MTLQEFYTRIGGNYEDTMRRLPSEAMIRKFVGKYPADPSYAQLEAAIEVKDWESAFRAAHTLKGVAQNLGFDSLYRVSAELTEALRGNKALKDYSLWEAVVPVQKNVLEAIRALNG